MIGEETIDILVEVQGERYRQDEKWGEQNHPICPEAEIDMAGELANAYRERCDAKAKIGTLAWSDILLEEVYEAFAEADPKRQREELIQVAAVAISMIECIDRHG